MIDTVLVIGYCAVWLLLVRLAYDFHGWWEARRKRHALAALYERALRSDNWAKWEREMAS